MRQSAGEHPTQVLTRFDKDYRCALAAGRHGGNYSSGRGSVDNHIRLSNGLGVDKTEKAGK